MTASWLAQMNIDTVVIDGATGADASESGAWRGPAPVPADSPTVTPAELAALLDDDKSETLVLDVTASANYVKAHVPGAWWIIRSRLANDLRALPEAKRYVVTCASSALARFAAPDVAALTGKPVHVLEGGTSAWIAAGLPAEDGDTRLASPRIDRYRRPYEGTDNAREAMNAYLEWEYGLVAQLERDGTHGFFVI
jgi:rhodanese-related sulfurtransferase